MKVPCRKHCDIPDGGLCPRHNCQKTKSWAALCRRYDAYFEAWEDGRGPGQKSAATLPSMAAQAWSLATALAAFVANPGFVDQANYQKRLEICEACEYRTGQRCSACGCFVALKAKGKAWGCPKGKWLAIEKPKPCGGCGRRKATA